MSTGGTLSGGPAVYEHGIATYSMGEYYTMTKDERFAELLKLAVTHIVQGQAPDGGWNYRYSKEPNSDTSVSGWQIQAL
jgi:rhamnogalacturonyl hydrolase YesR